jgi:hypothetical protein
MPKKRDGAKGRLPAHNNQFAFKHNAKSKKSEAIASVMHTGLCHRCTDKIVWKKKYRKYKPLKRSAKCYSCEQHNIKRAYHILCPECATAQHCCAWCKLDFTIGAEAGPVITREERAMQNSLKQAELEVQLGKLRERDRRSVLRQMAKSSEDESEDEDEGEEGEGEEGEGSMAKAESVTETETTEGGFLGQAVAQAKVAAPDQVDEEDITMDEDL